MQKSRTFLIGTIIVLFVVAVGSVGWYLFGRLEARSLVLDNRSQIVLPITDINIPTHIQEINFAATATSIRTEVQEWLNNQSRIQFNALDEAIRAGAFGHNIAERAEQMNRVQPWVCETDMNSAIEALKASAKAETAKWANNTCVRGGEYRVSMNLDSFLAIGQRDGNRRQVKLTPTVLHTVAYTQNSFFGNEGENELLTKVTDPFTQRFYRSDTWGSVISRHTLGQFTTLSESFIRMENRLPLSGLRATNCLKKDVVVRWDNPGYNKTTCLRPMTVQPVQ